MPTVKRGVNWAGIILVLIIVAAAVITGDLSLRDIAFAPAAGR